MNSQKNESEFIAHLPRLLYIGDVPVESTVAGSALIYRLLQEYPADRLCIIEGNIATSQRQKQLPDVTYETLAVGYERLLKSRFASLYSSYLFLMGRGRSQQLTRLINSFKPDAILTVAHGFSWLTASAIAEQYQLPLHLIIHDDWLSLCQVIPQLKSIANKYFREVYCQAQSRLCVSPYMMQYYQKHYGATGSVLYPSRALDVPHFDNPPKLRSLNNNSPIFAYAGSINLPGYVEALLSLASILQTLEGSLIIYSALTQQDVTRYGLDKKNIFVRPIIPFCELIHTLRQEVDVLFVPMTFEPKWQIHMELSFPSKLTDYTATGLPLLIWGPSYCSAVRWAKDNLGVAEVVENQDITAIFNAVEKLINNPGYRLQLANNSLLKGEKYFSYTSINEQFYKSIMLI